MVSRIPPVSPASTMFTYKASKAFGELRIAAESVAPPSTWARVPARIF